VICQAVIAVTALPLIYREFGSLCEQNGEIVTARNTNVALNWLELIGVWTGGPGIISDITVQCERGDRPSSVTLQCSVNGGTGHHQWHYSAVWTGGPTIISDITVQCERGTGHHQWHYIAVWTIGPAIISDITVHGGTGLAVEESYTTVFTWRRSIFLGSHLSQNIQHVCVLFSSEHAPTYDPIFLKSSTITWSVPTTNHPTF
jgi:hypothetical protein